MKSEGDTEGEGQWSRGRLAWSPPGQRPDPSLRPSEGQLGEGARWSFACPRTGVRVEAILSRRGDAVAVSSEDPASERRHSVALNGIELAKRHGHKSWGGAPVWAEGGSPRREDRTLSEAADLVSEFGVTGEVVGILENLVGGVAGGVAVTPCPRTMTPPAGPGDGGAGSHSAPVVGELEVGGTDDELGDPGPTDTSVVVGGTDDELGDSGVHAPDPRGARLPGLAQLLREAPKRCGQAGADATPGPARRPEPSRLLRLWAAQQLQKGSSDLAARPARAKTPPTVPHGRKRRRQSLHRQPYSGESIEYEGGDEGEGGRDGAARASTTSSHDPQSLGVTAGGEVDALEWETSLPGTQVQVWAAMVDGAGPLRCIPGPVRTRRRRATAGDPFPDRPGAAVAPGREVPAGTSTDSAASDPPAAAAPTAHADAVASAVASAGAGQGDPAAAAPAAHADAVASAPAAAAPAAHADAVASAPAAAAPTASPADAVASAPAAAVPAASAGAGQGDPAAAAPAAHADAVASAPAAAAPTASPADALRQEKLWPLVHLQQLLQKSPHLVSLVGEGVFRDLPRQILDVAVAANRLQLSELLGDVSLRPLLASDPLSGTVDPPMARAMQTHPGAVLGLLLDARRKRQQREADRARALQLMERNAGSEVVRYVSQNPALREMLGWDAETVHNFVAAVVGEGGGR